MNFFSILALIVCCLVALVLVRGLFNMARGGSANRSQQLMRLRVAVQALAIVLIVLAVYWSRGG